MKNANDTQPPQCGEDIPQIPSALKLLSPQQVKVVLALVDRNPSETLDQTARKIPMDRRSLYAYRHNQLVQAAVYELSTKKLALDVVEVRNAVVQRARKGSAYDSRTFLLHSQPFFQMKAELEKALDEFQSLLLAALSKEAPDVQARLANEIANIVSTTKNR